MQFEKGTKLMTVDGQAAGVIDAVVLDPKERKLVPMEWVSELGEKEIHLVVSPRFLDALPDYSPEDG